MWTAFLKNMFLSNSKQGLWLVSQVWSVREAFVPINLSNCTPISDDATKFSWQCTKTRWWNWWCIIFLTYEYKVILVISCTLFLEIYNIWGGGQCNTNWCYCKMLCTPAFYLCVCARSGAIQFTNLHYYYYINANSVTGATVKKSALHSYFFLYLCVCARSGAIQFTIFIIITKLLMII